MYFSMDSSLNDKYIWLVRRNCKNNSEMSFGSPSRQQPSLYPSFCFADSVYAHLRPEKRIVLDGDLCATCEMSADPRRPFSRTGVECSIGHDAHANECGSFSISK